jgi:hypothetical protein
VKEPVVPEKVELQNIVEAGQFNRRNSIVALLHTSSNPDSRLSACFGGRHMPRWRGSRAQCNLEDVAASCAEAVAFNAARSRISFTQ